MEKENNRVCGIDLLKIIMTVAVIILHWNNPGGGAGALTRTSITMNVVIMYCLESFCICAVNVFILISGYFMWKTSNRKIIKPIELIFETICVSVIMYILQWGLLNKNCTTKGIMNAFLPANYFVIFYIVLYVISPYINIILQELTIKTAKQFLIVIVLLFSVYPTVCDILSKLNGQNIDGISTITRVGSLDGYTIVHFIMLYIIGGCLGKFKVWRLDKKYCIAIIFLAVMITSAGGLFRFSKGGFDLEIIYAYSNPLVILLSIAVFTLFEKMKFKQVYLLSKLSSASFTVYLLHIYLLRIVPAKEIMEQTPIVMLLTTFIIISVIYFSCVFLHYIWKKFFLKIQNTIFRKLLSYELFNGKQ